MAASTPHIDDDTFDGLQRDFLYPQDERSWRRVVETARGWLPAGRDDLPARGDALRRHCRVLTCGAKAAWYLADHESWTLLREVLDRVVGTWRPPAREDGASADARVGLRTTLSYLHRNAGDPRRARAVLAPHATDCSRAGDVPLAALYKELGNVWRYGGHAGVADGCYAIGQRFLDAAAQADHAHELLDHERWSLYHFRAANACELFEYAPLCDARDARRLLALADDYLQPLAAQPPSSVNAPFYVKHRGFIAVIRGDLEGGTRSFDQALARFRELGFRKGEALCLYTRAVAWLLRWEAAVYGPGGDARERDLEGAREGFVLARAAAEQARYRRGVVLSTFNLGRCLGRLGERESARRELGAARTAARDIGCRFLEGVAGGVAAALDEPPGVHPKLPEVQRTLDAMLDASSARGVDTDTRGLRRRLRMAASAPVVETLAPLTSEAFDAYAAGGDLV